MTTRQGAVFSGRHEALDSLDFFPTPPWGVRALIKYVLPVLGLTTQGTCWEPAAGEGHMVEPLREYFGQVYASDIHDYGKGYDVGSFIGDGVDVAHCQFEPTWVVTNPPFKLGEEFVRRALIEAKIGVAMLARSVFIESAARYPLFSSSAFAAFAPFCSRLPMVKGRWDPAASSATSYAWFVWLKAGVAAPRVIMIPPTAQKTCSRPDDVARFGKSLDTN